MIERSLYVKARGKVNVGSAMVRHGREWTRVRVFGF